MTASRERVPIDYRMRPPQGRWMVVDLSIEGVSLVNHFRKTFSGALANMTIDQLIERLKRQVPPRSAAERGIRVQAARQRNRRRSASAIRL